jgi:hypothetical protein
MSREPDYTIPTKYKGGPATVAQLQELHHLVCVRCLEYLRDTPATRMKAQMLSVIRAFLKDQGIKATPATPAESLADTLEAIAFSDMPFGSH